MQEEWKNIIGFEGLYDISNKSRVRSIFRYKIILKPILCKNGYLSYNLCKNNIQKKKTIHRLIAIAFVPNPDNKPCINHIDGNKLNNNIDNLEWVTHKENIQHASNFGLMSGRQHLIHPSTKLYEKDIINIRLLLTQGISLLKISILYKVSKTLISQIKLGKKWKRVI